MTMLRIGNSLVVALSRCRVIALNAQTRKRTNAQTKKGFTLIEVMVATAVLSFSVVMIYQAFFTLLDSFSYCVDYLDVVCWADEKLWTAQDSLTHNGSLSPIETRGEFININKKFEWVLSQELLDDTGPLYKVNLDLLWRQGKREIRLSRTAYAIYEKSE